ncbi:MAG: CopG family transcriptional regulator [Betaproteobacteria bacterium]|nr:MAG: CopG family transcriptional regulator [Betaproteobacteria bacterium]TAG47970.1 MAG: CopG family transcriptional regulator [Betaproteobacteria bacterium]
MSQVTVYLDDEAERVLRERAAASGLSQSKWISQLIRQSTAQAWPADVVALSGAWADDAAIAPLCPPKRRSRTQPSDVPRESW